jgi:hypothetical protein
VVALLLGALWYANSNRGFAIRNCGRGRGRVLLRRLGAACMSAPPRPAICLISLAPLLLPIRNLQVAETAAVGATSNRGTAD